MKLLLISILLIIVFGAKAQPGIQIQFGGHYILLPKDSNLNIIKYNNPFGRQRRMLTDSLDYIPIPLIPKNSTNLSKNSMFGTIKIQVINKKNLQQDTMVILLKNLCYGGIAYTPNRKFYPFIDYFIDSIPFIRGTFVIAVKPPNYNLESLKANFKKNKIIDSIIHKWVYVYKNYEWSKLYSKDYNFQNLYKGKYSYSIKLRAWDITPENWEKLRVKK